MIVLIPYINLLNLSWIKMSIFEEYGAVEKARMTKKKKKKIKKKINKKKKNKINKKKIKQ